MKKTISKVFRIDPYVDRVLKEGVANDPDPKCDDSKYLRKLILSQQPANHPKIKKILLETQSEINKVGVNINQIVKNHNSNFYSLEDKKKLFEYMEKIKKNQEGIVYLISRLGKDG